MIKSEFNILLPYKYNIYTKAGSNSVHYLVLSYHQKIEFKLLNLSLKFNVKRTYITIMLQQP